MQLVFLSSITAVASHSRTLRRRSDYAGLWLTETCAFAGNSAIPQKAKDLAIVSVYFKRLAAAPTMSTKACTDIVLSMGIPTLVATDDPLGMPLCSML